MHSALDFDFLAQPELSPPQRELVAPEGMRKRQSRRATPSAEIELGLPGTYSLPRYAANVSKTGVFVVTPEPLAVGAVVRFRLYLSATECPCGLARVIWVRQRRDLHDEPPGMGMRFLYLESEGMRLLERFVNDYFKTKGHEDPDRTREISRDELARLEAAKAAAATRPRGPLRMKLRVGGGNRARSRL